MIYCGGIGLEFTCNNFHCILNDNFNIVLFSDFSIIKDDVSHSVGFTIPVDYLSFIKTININNNLKTNLDEIFKFKNSDDLLVLKNFVKKINKTSYEIINDLKHSEKSNRKSELN